MVVQIERVWAMPSPWTFTIKPIKQLLNEEITSDTSWWVESWWVDPFAGKHSPALITNDINPHANAVFHMDALEFLQGIKSEMYKGVIYDPPYSNEQYRISYREAGRPINTKVFNAHYNAEIKNNMARILKPGGKAICFGWNSTGLGKKRGFELYRVLLVCHGRQHNDTIVTCEKKNI